MKRLLDFYADWCQPCKAMAPVLRQIQMEFPDVDFIEINIEKEPNKAQAYGIMSIPTYVIEEGDEELARLTGVTTKDILEKSLKD